MESVAQPIMVPVPMGHPIPMNMPMGGHAAPQHGPWVGPNVPMMGPHMGPMMGPSQPMMGPHVPMNQMGPHGHYHPHMMGPGPMMGPHPHPHPQPHQPPHHSHAPHVNQIPISIFTKLQQDDSSSQRQSGEGDDQPITIIAREEQVIPIFQESRGSQSGPVGGQMSVESRTQQSSEEREQERERGPMQAVMAEARLVPEARALLAEIPEDRSLNLPAVPAEMVRPPPLPFQRMPVNVVSPSMIQDDNVPEQDEQPRPHYVQPRSVRSTDRLLKPEEPKRRVRRGTCECTLH